MILSVREVVGRAERCFAAAGFDEGTARSNASAIWWTEAYRGTGLSTLHSLLEPLEEMETMTPELERRDSPISVLEGNGHPCLLSGVPALDLAGAHADRYGTGVTYVKQSGVGIDGNVLGALAHRGAKRGDVTLVLSVDDDGESRTVLGIPRQSRPALAETTLDDPSRGIAAIEHAVRTDRQGAHEAPLFRAFFDDRAAEPFNTVDAQLLYRLVSQSADPKPDAEADTGFVVACINTHHPRYSDEARQVFDRIIHTDDRFETQFQPEMIDERVERLINEGVEVDRDLWQDIFEFGNGILAPPFEGSEKGAGFDLNELEG